MSLFNSSLAHAELQKVSIKEKFEPKWYNMAVCLLYVSSHKKHRHTTMFLLCQLLKII